MKKSCCIIINNHNGEKFLEQTICSTLCQTAGRENYDVFFVDAGSTDNSRVIYEKYHNLYPENTFLYFTSRKNQAVTVNNVIRSLIDQYEYFSWINSDDLYTVNFIEEHMKVFKQSPKIGMVHSFSIWFQEIKDKFGALAWGNSDIHKGLFEQGKNFVCHPSTMIARWVFKKHGFFNETFDYSIHFFGPCFIIIL